jgi:hypothetical protein
MPTLRAAFVVIALASRAFADPPRELARVVALERSGKPAVVAATIGRTERELAKKGYSPSHGSLVLAGGIEVWPAFDASHRVDRIELGFHADFDATVALLVKQWGKPKLTGSEELATGPRLASAVWWWPKLRLRAWAEWTTVDNVEIRFASYRPLDSVDFDKLFALRGRRIAAIEKRLGVESDLGFETGTGLTATFDLGYTEFGELMIGGERHVDRLDDVTVVLMCPLGTMPRLLARVRRLAPGRKLVATHTVILEVRRR